MGLNRSLRAQKSSLDWWCYILIGRCCWMRSTRLSCLLIFGSKKMHAFVVCSCVVATDESFLLVSLLVMLSLSTC